MKKSHEIYITGTGQKVYVHTKEQCIGRHCVIHNPSNHHMRDWPTHWREDLGMMERICECDVGHPDPDDLEFRIEQAKAAGIKNTSFIGVHGCCGCCNPQKWGL